MPDREGNVLRPPGLSAKAEVKPIEIMASYARFTQKGVTMAGGQGVIAAGTVMGRVTSTKKYVPYTDAATNGAGSDTALGVLRESVDTGTGGAPPTGTNMDALGDIVMSGILKNSLLVGLTASAITDLNGRVDTPRDYFIF